MRDQGLQLMVTYDIIAGQEMQWIDEELFECEMRIFGRSGAEAWRGEEAQHMAPSSEVKYRLQPSC